MEVAETDWMIMGMIHAYKIIQKTKEQDEECSLNDVDYPYLVELQRRDIEKPSLLSAEFPYVFQERNTSAHDNVHLGMMNVFTILDEKKEEGKDLDTLDVSSLMQSLSCELENRDLVESYENFFVDVRREGLEELK